METTGPAAEFKQEGFELTTDVVDLSKREAIEAAAQSVLRKHNQLDILVNNAGVVTGKPFLDCEPMYIQRTMDVNINAHFWTCRAFLPNMIQRKHGHVVTIASMAGHAGTPRLADYAASKFAAVGFDESLRVEMKMQKTNVKTTCVCPFYISTGMFEGAQSRFNFLLPILTPAFVASEIVSAVKRNEPVLMLPWMSNTMVYIRLLPIPIQDFLLGVLGMHSSMDHFTGGRNAQPSAAAKKNQ